jgi:hypothetical protein
MFVLAKAGHLQGSTTERYLHAHKPSYPDAAEVAEARTRKFVVIEEDQAACALGSFIVEKELGLL